ncbi:MAG: ADP-ribosylglycohydrolase family protein [Oscillatoriales cyanobacterium SM2_1_8]|nr:ADP-ribosylglycohydrolase family protein [Oscillatoriales cyanobacterium SM2_1_8]
MNQTQILGVLLGTAVGDALGLPYEGLSPQRARRLWGPPDRHRFWFGWGMVSDDTEHTVLVAQAFLAADGDATAFANHLGRGLRGWLLGLPAGIGGATLRAILKLWLGYPPTHSGVFSAGNGPAMRSGILGAIAADLPQLRALVRASTRTTHTDPRAEYGALTIALAVRHAGRGEVHGPTFHQDLAAHVSDGPWLAHIQQAVTSVTQGETTPQFLARQGWDRGVSGFVEHCIPVAVHIWLSHPQDYAAAVMTAIQCGGDTDSLAAMVGAMVGAAVGPTGIPEVWCQRLWEPMHSVAGLTHLAADLATGRQSPRPHWGTNLLGFGRNLCFLAIVLGHGLRRLAPPYA